MRWADRDAGAGNVGACGCGKAELGSSCEVSGHTEEVMPFGGSEGVSVGFLVSFNGFTSSGESAQCFWSCCYRVELFRDGISSAQSAGLFLLSSFLARSFLIAIGNFSVEVTSL